MIRLFKALSNTLYKNFTDEAIFQNETTNFKHYNTPCPKCGASGKLAPHGDYSRWLVSIESTKRVRPPRYKCASCGKTHALLPDIIIPYSQYSFRFKLSVLIAYYERESTVEKICEQFKIAVSTLYRWKAIFLSHKELFLGILGSQKQPDLSFLRSLFGSDNLSEWLCGFFRKYAFSFMQSSHIAAQSAPP